jgi:hypothetical protein
MSGVARQNRGGRPKKARPIVIQLLGILCKLLIQNEPPLQKKERDLSQAVAPRVEPSEHMHYWPKQDFCV